MSEEGSHNAQFTYSVDSGLPQAADGKSNLQVPASVSQVSGTLRPGLPRSWSGTSEPADLYSSLGVTNNLGYSASGDSTDIPAEAMVVHTMTPEGKLVAGMSLEPLAPQQNLLAFDPQQTSNNISPAATDYDSRDSMLASEYHHVYSNPASAAPSTPKSISSRGPSKATTQSDLRDFRIPGLQPSFFESDFYRRFHIQSMSLRRIS